MRPYYERGGITIYHGDALDVLSDLRGNSIALAVTDPPYVIGAVSAGNIGSKAGGWGDMMNSSRWFRDWYAMVRRALKPTGALWTFCNWRSLPVVMKAAADTNWSVCSALVWNKDWIGPGGVVGLRPAYEMVALLPGAEFAIPNRGLPDVWVEKWSAVKPHGHPAEKPVPLIARIIRASGTLAGETLLDPFMGSGTSLVAAQACGIDAIGIEVEERYCEIAARRLEQDTLPLEALT